MGLPAQARPPHKKALADYLGPGLARKLNDCRTCHLVPEEGADPAEDRPHNAFGKRLKAVRSQLRKAGKPSGIPARVEAVASEDSDGDGVPNLLELVTGHFPGEADDTPAEAELARGRDAIAALERARSGYPWNPFERVERPDVPVDRSRGWVRNPIDAFIAVEHEARGLTPRPEASRPMVLRRLYLDLTGLPPTPDELHAFLADEAPDAYEKVVDRLLASPRYGERWGRHWMDVWRYSDWAGWGQQVRDSQPHIWHWRDWIVESLNKDKPYDRMVVEMLAADEDCPDDLDALRATGYLARNFKLLSREKWMQDVVDHTGQAFLGVTIGCARCHDHMYDPTPPEGLLPGSRDLRAASGPDRQGLPARVDTAKDGIPRAYDAQLDARTLLFVRGDDRYPTGNPLSPGVPDSLGGRFEVKPVPMPLTAIDPDRRKDVIRAQLDANVEALARAEVALHRLGTNIEGRRENRAGAMRCRGGPGADRGPARSREGRSPGRPGEEGVEGVDRGRDSGDGRTEKSGRRRGRPGRGGGAAIASEGRAGPAGRGRQGPRRCPQGPGPRPGGHSRSRPARAIRPRRGRSIRPPARGDGWRSPDGSRTGPTRSRPGWPSTTCGAATSAGRSCRSVNDFGRNGQPPSHPALLDWLAAELMDRGWSMKAIHRLIVTSATYRQDSRPDPSDLARDPDNVFLWRWAPRRAEAEVVRDCVFAVAGSLDSTLGGPDIDHKAGLTVPRRSLYFQHAAEKQMEFLQIFDAAGVTECYRRKDSILPQQALALANSELSLRMARQLARHALGPDRARLVRIRHGRI